MTTVCFKDGVMASDSRVCLGHRILGSVQKVFNFPEYLIGAAGSLSAMTQFITWFTTTDRLEPPATKLEGEFKGFEAIVYFKDTKTVHMYTESFIADEVKAEFYTLGSGSDIAAGAMAMGASAPHAIEIASQFDRNTGGEIQIEYGYDIGS